MRKVRRKRKPRISFWNWKREKVLESLYKILHLSRRSQFVSFHNLSRRRENVEWLITWSAACWAFIGYRNLSLKPLITLIFNPRHRSTIEWVTAESLIEIYRRPWRHLSRDFPPRRHFILKLYVESEWAPCLKFSPSCRTTKILPSFSIMILQRKINFVTFPPLNPRYRFSYRPTSFLWRWYRPCMCACWWACGRGKRLAERHPQNPGN